MQNKKKRSLLFFSILLIFFGIAVLIVVIVRNQKESTEIPSSISDESMKDDELVEDMGNTHIEDVSVSHESYNSIPPTSGAHVGSSIAPWGIHNEQIPDELQVHNLEDGGVIIHYDPVRVDGDMIEKLRGTTNKYATQVILEPYTTPPLPSPVVLTAWTRMLELQQFDEGRIETFLRTYRGIDHHISNE